MSFWLKLTGVVIGATGVGLYLLNKRSYKFEEYVKAREDEYRHVSLTIKGRKLPRVFAQAQENILDSDPENLDARALVIGYFGRAFNSKSDRDKYLKHALWIIENKPRTRLVRECRIEKVLGKESEQAYETGKALWLKHLDESPNDLILIENAAAYFTLYDKSIAESLFQKGQKLDPESPEWGQRLSHLYSLRSKGANETDDASKALEEMEKAFSLSHKEIPKLSCLQELSTLAFKANEFEKARKYALESLEFVKEMRDDYKSDCLHRNHTVLGRLAFA